jgi:hypothetical protein
MAERKIATAEPVTPDLPYVSPEELAGAARPAVMTLDRRGGSPQFANMPTPKPAIGQVPLPMPAIPGAPAEMALPSSRGVSPETAPPLASTGATTTPAAQAQVTFELYESKSPVSMYDDDVEFTHTLSRVLGIMGLPEESMDVRGLHLKLQAGRMDDVGAQAQRAFAAGDVTRVIDMVNHMVPNGKKITGYSKTPDKKSFAFQLQDGSTETKTLDEIAQSVTMMRDPNMFGAMMKTRATQMAEFEKERAMAGIKSGYSIQEALAKGFIDESKAMRLKELELANGKNTTHIDLTGRTVVDKANGQGTVEIKWKPSSVPGSKEMVPVEVPLTQPTSQPGRSAAPQMVPVEVPLTQPTSQPGRSAAPQSGYSISPEFIKRIIAPAQ